MPPTNTIAAIGSLSLVILLATACRWVVSAVAQPIIVPALKGEQCVADVDLMRTDHMELLNHQRDDTVLEGIRGASFSLVGCVDCHAQSAGNGEAIRVDAEGQFCQSCHTYAAVKIDCFSCHAAVPAKVQQIGSRNKSMLNRDYNRVMSQYN